MISRCAVSSLFLSLLPVVAAGQAPPVPNFKVDVVSKSAKAINYQIGTGPTKIGFVGTALMSGASGQASVESKKGYFQIDARFNNITPAQNFGAEYLTYVLWSISPEGRTANLGEIILKNGAARLSVTTDLQIFGLFVTAEPYFAVRMPSDVIVLENEVLKDTRGKIYIIDSKLELLKRGQYAKLANPLDLRVDLKAAPLELYEARNAVQVARAFEADKYAADTFEKAEASLKMAERLPATQDDWNEIARTSRQAAQIAEDSRAISVERQAQEKLEQERAEAQRQTEMAQQKAAQESLQRAQAEQARKAAEQARALAEKQAALAEAQKAAAEQARLIAQLEAARAGQAQSQAEVARMKAQQDATAAEAARAKAVADRVALRERLLQQFNQALPTTDTARGLVVNMGDLLFDTGKYDLRPEAQIKLARLAGICLAYPDLRLQAEGYTDNTGSPQLNQKLSQQRADAVHDFLVAQGLPAQNVTAQGFGEADPVASNNTLQGRQQNRRVELVVSGEVIGSAIGKPNSAQ